MVVNARRQVSNDRVALKSCKKPDQPVRGERFQQEPDQFFLAAKRQGCAVSNLQLVGCGPGTSQNKPKPVKIGPELAR